MGSSTHRSVSPLRSTKTIAYGLAMMDIGFIMSLVMINSVQYLIMATICIISRDYEVPCCPGPSTGTGLDINP